MARCIICEREEEVLDFPFLLHGVEHIIKRIPTFGIIPSTTHRITERLITSSRPYICLNCIKTGTRESAAIWLKRMGAFTIGLGFLMFLMGVGCIATEESVMPGIFFLLVAIFIGFFIYSEMNRRLKLAKSPNEISKAKQYLKKNTDILHDFFGNFVKPTILSKYKHIYSDITDVLTSYDGLSILTLCDDCAYGRERDGATKHCGYHKQEDGRCLKFRRLDFLEFMKFW